MKTKSKIITAIALIVIIIAVILNIVLLSSDIFKSTYTYRDGNSITKITFYDNTYTSITTERMQITGTNLGFYQYIPKVKYKETEYDTLILQSVKGNSVGYRRNSVFSFTYAPDSENEETYTCGVAIFLQVLYILLILGSIIFLLVYHKPLSDKNIQNKMHKEMTDSLDNIELNELKKDGE